MTTLPFSLGPTNDWDPQGYNEEEELEDELMKAGMTVKEEDDEDEEDEKAEEDEFDEEDEEDDDDEDDDEDEDEDYEEDMVDPIAALDDLADQVNREERETLKFKDFDE